MVTLMTIMKMMTVDGNGDNNEDDDDQGHNYDANFGQWGGRFPGGFHLDHTR